MKQLTGVFSLIFLLLYSCNNGSEVAATTNTSTRITTSQETAVTDPTIAPVGGVDANVSASLKGLVDGYLHLKNALSNDNPKDAAVAGHEIIDAMKNVEQSAMSTDQKKVYLNLADDIKENAEHISDNANKIAHQREHFEMLSKDIYDLVKTFGAGQTLFQDFCPMANDGKGATWLSEIKEIKNPYMGKAMSTCGEVKEVLK